MAISSRVEKPALQPRGIKLVHLFYVVLAIPIVAAFAFAIYQPIQVLPRISLAPGFALTDQNGARLTNEDLRGKLVLYHFTYTGCGEECGASAQIMQDVQAMALNDSAEDIPLRLVTISFDPEQDSPEQLGRYATELGADDAVWHFVSGDADRLKNIIGGGFSAYYGRDGDGNIEFDPMFVLVDGWNIIRAKYRTSAPDIEKIQRDIGMIRTEVENSQGATRIAYEAAHLFLCYPD